MRPLDPALRVVAMVDPDEAGARARLPEQDREGVVFYPTLDEMVGKAKLDALVIGTRCDLHTPYAIEAAKYDLPLFLEKPVANSLEQATALEAAFEGSRCPVVVSFPLRVSPLCTFTRARIAAGAIGRPEHILGVNYVTYGVTYFECFYRNFAVTQGLFLQKATHDLDYMSYLLDAPIVRVAAMGLYGRVFGGDRPAGLTCVQCDRARTCPESPGYRHAHQNGYWEDGDHLCPFGEDIGTPETGMNEDASSALLQFANGAQGVYTQVFFARRDAAQRGATITGYDGTLSFDWYRNTARYVRHHQPFTDDTTAGEGMGHFGGDHVLAQNFLGLIRGEETTSITPIEAGIQSAYTCLAAKASAEQGCFMDVRQVGATPV
jgi:predicted dehydrogenase